MIIPAVVLNFKLSHGMIANINKRILAQMLIHFTFAICNLFLLQKIKIFLRLFAYVLSNLCDIIDVIYIYLCMFEEIGKERVIYFARYN